MLKSAVNISINGVGPFIWIPLANVYGRRPIYLFTTFLGFASALGCAYTRNYGELLVARVFNGFFPAAMALGASTVVDLFFFHQRYVSLCITREVDSDQSCFLVDVPWEYSRSP